MSQKRSASKEMTLARSAEFRKGTKRIQCGALTSIIFQEPITWALVIFPLYYFFFFTREMDSVEKEGLVASLMQTKTNSQLGRLRLLFPCLECKAVC